MLQSSTLGFLKDLTAHNDKSWFDAHRSEYEAARKDFNAFVGKLIQGLAGMDPAFGHLQVKDCVFRINRDVRFSNDKRPYKTNMGAGFTPGGKKVFVAGYYFHCEPGKSFVAGGCWMPEAANLKKIRQEIDYNFDAFRGIVEAPSFVKTFGELSREDGYLSRPPKGYEEGNPALPYLKYKSFTTAAPLTDAQVTGKGLETLVMDRFRQLQPLVKFLSDATAAE